MRKWRMSMECASNGAQFSLLYTCSVSVNFLIKQAHLLQVLALLFIKQMLTALNNLQKFVEKVLVLSSFEKEGKVDCKFILPKLTLTLHV
jgi:hypothetical protein